MKKVLFVTASVLAISLYSSGKVLGDEVEKSPKRQYLFLYGGNSSWKNTSNSNEIESGTRGFGLGLTYGRTLKDYPSLSYEVDVSYRNNEIHGVNSGGSYLSADGNTLNLFNFGINLRYTYNLTNSLVYGFFGPGVGYAWITQSDPVRDLDLKTKVMLTGQVGGGIEYKVTETMGINFGYRYLTSLNNIEVEESGRSLRDRYDSHMIYGGLTYRF